MIKLNIYHSDGTGRTCDIKTFRSPTYELVAGINAFRDYIRYFNSGLFIARGNKIHRV